MQCAWLPNLTGDARTTEGLMYAVTQGCCWNGRRASEVGKTLQISDEPEIMAYVTRATAPIELPVVTGT